MNWQILQGDVRERLADIPAGSVQTCVTSPPYWGLRDYGHDGQIGAEAHPDLYVAALTDVFRAVRRVLKDDGTIWLNLGDCYAGAGYSNHENTGGAQRVEGGKQKHLTSTGAKNKDLIGIPWRVAFALQADGWYLRSDIIWHKPNPMPESVTDRPTKAHEYIFLLTKSARYYYDAAAIREPYAPSTIREFMDGYDGHAKKDYAAAGAQNPSDVKKRIVDKQRQAGGRRYAGFNDRWDASVDNKQHYAAANIPGQSPHGYTKRDDGLTSMAPIGGANKRTVWTVATHPYPDAHFATYPPALIEPCILAGSRVGDTVLDPFNGSGTTGEVAIRHQRNYIGIELNPAYIELARKRIGAVAPMFAEEKTA